MLSFSLGRDAMPVDTHVHRVTKRLGLVPPKASAERADRILHELVPEGLRTPLHVALIRLGREICKAPIPRCHDLSAEGHLSDRAAIPPDGDLRTEP